MCGNTYVRLDGDFSTHTLKDNDFYINNDDCY